MRLPADDEELAVETIAAAAEAGVTVFDTARAYDGNEALLARALRSAGAERRARIVTKGGMARTVGVCNVNRRLLDQALELAPVAAVQVALSPFDDRALRGGVVERCAGAGISVIAHSPLGGPRRARALARNEALVDVAQGHGAT